MSESLNISSPVLGAAPAAVRGARSAGFYLRPALVAGTILLFMVGLDGPVAESARHWPAGLVHAARMVSTYAKGGYFLLASFVATLAMLVAALAVRGPARAMWRLRLRETGFVFVAASAATLASIALKFVIGRARPALLDADGPLAFFPFSTTDLKTSFPSGEATMSISFFLAVVLVVRPYVGDRWASLMLVPALLVAASRVIICAHYVSDVLAAAALSAAVVLWLFSKAGLAEARP
jgi:undecaprenyl-diphosphatase